MDCDPLILSPKAEAILCYLRQNAGKVVDHDQLLDAVWPDIHIHPEAVKVYIHEIRRALGDDPNCPTYIQTVPRRGYRFLTPADPALIRRRTPNGLYGRDLELAQLNDICRAVMAGERQGIFISGEIGIGKTALVEAFASSAAAKPEVLVTIGRCIRIGGLQEPYYAVLEALGRISAEDFPAKLATAPTLAAQFPRLFSASELERIRTDSACATPGRMLREICEFIELLSSSSAMVLILEDVQWADSATVDFISALARRTEPAKLMVVCTLRNSDPASNDIPIAQVVRELGIKNRWSSLELKPLDRTAISGMVFRALGRRAASDHLLDRVATFTGGNPLFLRSVVQYLLETGTHAADEAASCQSALHVSEHLQRFLHGQFLEMADEDRTLLEYAAVAGVSFTAYSLAPLLGIDPEEADQRYERLAANCTWIELAGTESVSPSTVTSRFEFRHGLYRDVIYCQLGRARRARIHRALAEHLENAMGELSGERSAELAWRYQECGNFEKADHYLELAGGQAIERSVSREAELLFNESTLLAARRLCAEEKSVAMGT
jgi:predicted ATPase